MINLSKSARERPDYPLSYRLKYLFHPDVYMAENIKDFQENAPTKMPCYKRMGMGRSFDRVIMRIANLGIKTNCACPDGGKLTPPWFVLHDSTGWDIAVWNDEDYFLGTPFSYEKAQKEQCLKDNDWVYEVYFTHFLENKLNTILEVNKYRFSNRKPEKESLLEKLKSFLPDQIPVPQKV